ncbi:hypothetical protein [Frateuria sp.]|uniref:hypothetical protein n=1 Tax=Frateuria sp. TaxID=2211372 RepID=UPI0025BCCF25|nr:hypothetical protein [Frateuria sp.]
MSAVTRLRRQGVIALALPVPSPDAAVRVPPRHHEQVYPGGERIARSVSYGPRLEF